MISPFKKNGFIKQAHGYTLVEVLVSIVILGIIVGAVSSVTITLQKIEKRNIFGKYALEQVNQILQQFAISPRDFFKQYPLIDQEAVPIYCDEVCFQLADEPTNHYFLLVVHRENAYLTLTITVYYNASLYIPFPTFQRTIYWEDGS